MADTTIDNLSIQVAASADSAIRMLERLASSADRLRGAASGVADALRDEATAARDVGTETQQAGQQSGQAARGINQFWSSIRQAGSVIGSGFANAVMRAHRSVSGFITGIARIAKFRIYRTIIKDLGQSFKDLYGYSDAFGLKFADSMDKITTAVTYLRNSIAAMTAPLINALAPVFDLIVDKIVEAMNLFNEFLAAITGASTFTVAKKVAVSFGDTISSSGKKAKKAADDIKRTILGFDEINKLVSQKDSSSGSTGSSPYSDKYKLMFEERNVSSGLKNMSAALEKALSDSISRMDTILSGGSLAIGALLAFSGTNVPLGLALMANGAAGLAKQITAHWDGLDDNIKEVIGRIELILIGAELAVGALLAFSGTNVPLGLSLMAAGAFTAVKSIVWGGLLTGGIDNVLKNILTILAGASLAVGAVLAFSGANIPVGIGMMATGIALGGTSLLWGGAITGSLKNVISNITLIVSGASLAVGALLAFTGTNIPLGIVMMGAGVGGIAASITWGGVLTGSLTNVLNNIDLIVSGAELALGALLAFTGTSIPTGIALMAMGAGRIATSISWGSGLSDSMQNTLNNLKIIVSGAELVVGAILALSGAATPIGLVLMAKGAVGLISGLSQGNLNWDSLGDLIGQKLDGILKKYQSFVSKAKGIFDGFGKKLNGFFGDVAQGFRIAFGLETPGQNDGSQYIIPMTDPDADNKYGTSPVVGGGAKNALHTGTGRKSSSAFLPDPSVIKVLNDFADKAKTKTGEITSSFKTMSTKSTKYTLSLADGLKKSKTNALNISFEPVGENITNTLSEGQTQTWPEAKSKFDKSMEELRNSGYTYSYDAIGKYIVNTLSGGINSDAWQAIKTISDLAWNMFHKPEEVPWITFGESIPEDIGTGISNNQYSAVQVATDLGWYIYNGFSGISFWDIGYNICADIYNGIVENVNWVQKAAKSLVSSVGGYITGKNRLTVSTTTVKRSTASKPKKSTRANALGGIFSNGIWSDIPQYANGTLNAGSLFWAGENGPEIVGRAGGRTEVLNRSQIASAMYSAVQAAMAPAAANFAAAANYLQSNNSAFDMEMLAEMVRQGVESAMERQGDIQRQQLDTLRQINAKEFSTEISTASISKAQARMNRRAGMTVVPVSQ